MADGKQKHRRGEEEALPGEEREIGDEKYEGPGDRENNGELKNTKRNTSSLGQRQISFRESETTHSEWKVRNVGHAQDIDSREDDASGVVRSLPCNSRIQSDWNPKVVERPIENEEWIVFLQRSMEEIMDGEIGSLLQQNCVSVFVSPLRNTAAGCRVVEYVACLLSLPFVVSLTKDSLEKITQVYLDVRVVPNLVYSLKLLMSERGEPEKKKKSEPRNANTRSASTLSADELQTLEYTMLVLCRLVYNRQQFLTQFCDAVYIVNGVVSLQQLLSLEKRRARVVADLIAILSNVLRSQPENAHLVEKVVLHSHLSGKCVRSRNPLICISFFILSLFFFFVCFDLFDPGTNEIFSWERRRVDRTTW